MGYTSVICIVVGDKWSDIHGVFAFSFDHDNSKRAPKVDVGVRSVNNSVQHKLAVDDNSVLPVELTDC